MRASMVITLLVTLSLSVGSAHGQTQPPAPAPPQAVDAPPPQPAENLAQVLTLLAGIEQDLKAVRNEVDQPLISELWFGFVSDRVNAVLNTMLGFESEAATPFWAAGGLSLLLLLLKTLLWVLDRSKPDSKAARVLGPVFSYGLSIYLIVLTGSLFLLAASARGSSIDSYERQLETSTELTMQMQATSVHVESLLKALTTTSPEIDRLTRTLIEGRTTSAAAASLPPATIAAIQRIDNLSSGHLPAVTTMKNDLAALKADVQTVTAAQHGMLWTALVALAAFASVATLALVLRSKNRHQVFN
jgi:hypothetical protein